MRKSVDLINKPSDEPAAASGDEVFEAIHTVMHLFRSEQFRVLRDGPHDLTHMESKVLKFYARNPGTTLRDLAAQSGRDKGQLARLIGSLKERGLLEARPDDADRRNILLQLTPEGRSVQQALQRQARRVSDMAVKGLSPQERGLLTALLEKVRANLDTAS